MTDEAKNTVAPSRLVNTRLGPIDNHWIDTSGCVAGDIHCRYCHYNLRTLSVTGICPECGRLVANSEPLYHRPLAWLRKLRSGMALIVLSMLAGLLGAVAVSSVSGQWPRSVGETWGPDIWFYGVLLLAMTVPGLIWLAGILLLTTSSTSDSLPFRRSLRLLLVLNTPIWIFSAIAEALCGRISLEVGRAMGLAATILSGVMTCLVLICVGELMRRVPCRRLARSAYVLVCVTIPVYAVTSLWAAVSLFQTIVIDEPSRPYAYEVLPSETDVTPMPTTVPTTTHYMVVDANGEMTRTTTVPASMLAQPKQWPQWVIDLSLVGGRLIDLVGIPRHVYEAAVFLFFSMAWWHLHGGVKRRARLQ